MSDLLGHDPFMARIGALQRLCDEKEARLKLVEAQLAEAWAVLKLVEWADSSACPICYRYEATEYAISKGMDNLGHAPDCRLQKALRDGGNPDVGEIMGGPIGGRLFPR